MSSTSSPLSPSALHPNPHPPTFSAFPKHQAAAATEEESPLAAKLRELAQLRETKYSKVRNPSLLRSAPLFHFPVHATSLSHSRYAVAPLDAAHPRLRLQ